VSRIPISLPAFALISLFLLSACEFRSRRAYWRLDPSVTYKVRYSAETRATADGTWGSVPYVSAAEAEFSAQSTGDTSKGQIEFALAVDTLRYRSSERGSDEDQYMTGRLRKYKGKLILSRTGQALSLEEEPGLPPVAFSPLNFGRMLAYALPTFPEFAIKKGSRWEINQSLMDKFHPDSRVQKRFTLSAIRETPEGDLAHCLVDMDAYLDEDLGNGDNPGKPSLSGSGKVVFNLTTGKPVSAELELEGHFLTRGSPSRPGDSTQTEAFPMQLREKLAVSFEN
jgi:hypothetical protein